MQFTLLVVTQLLSAATLTAAQRSSSTGTCGKLDACYIRDLTTGKETKLSTTTPYTYDYIAGKSSHSVRCDVGPADGKRSKGSKKTSSHVDEMEFTFMPGNEVHKTWGEPYWIDGSNGNWVEPADFLASCGSKTLKVKGSTWVKECFTATYSFVAKCSTDCVFDLTAVNGTASVVVNENTLTIDFKGAKPNTVYTAWVDFQNRATGKLATDYPVPANEMIDLTYSGSAMPRGVGPAFGKTCPVYEGMRLDVNSVKTDEKGNGKMMVMLDYNLLQKGASPVVADKFTMQGDNVIGGSWLRKYEKPIADGPSSQVLDAKGVPKLVTATAQGLTIVGHFKPFTHGHYPGVGGVDHFMGAMGDFPAHCLMD